ncbi:hypothetical protein HOB10_01155 [Candidatus Parcubacteria bacterium]|jgi:hypothetical protein|nr:hypothetical protein [Candidatus Parcubacteria bacterium]
MINNFQSPLNLKLIKKCPVCNMDYQQSMIQVLDENEYGLLTYATCKSCGANLLTKFASLPQGVIGNAILTDLKPQEVMDFAGQDDLSDNDVLDIQYLISKKELINNLKKLT